MIEVSRLNGTRFYLNAEMIESVEGTPDTVITLSNGHKYVVVESVEEVVKRVIDYKRSVGLWCRLGSQEGEERG